MREEKFRYTWNEGIYQELLLAKENGDYMGISSNSTGKIISVEKKHEDDMPYIEVTFEVKE